MYYEWNTEICKLNNLKRKHLSKINLLENKLRMLDLGLSVPDDDIRSVKKKIVLEKITIKILEERIKNLQKNVDKNKNI